VFRRTGQVDKILAFLVATLVIGGALIFASAAFGLVARGSTAISSVVLSHLVLGIGCGVVSLIVAVYLDYKYWRRIAPYLYVFALLLTALVFVPHIGLEHGGGKRWIVLAHISLQPSEFLKIAVIVIGAAYFASMHSLIATWRYGLGGFLALLAGPAVILVLQPDIGTLGVITFSLFSIYFAAGARMQHVATALCLGILALGILTMAKPYIRDRVMTFFDPSQGQQAESYQIKQSLIAIGSGGLTGRGFGQGIQKFTYLPEPMGDSIFAVAGEELGFVGSALLVILFLAFALRGYAISTRASDSFGSLLAVGISTYLAIEAFINIAAMLGVAPLTGIPLTFISQGGSAMLASLASAGILLSVSRYKVGKR
jgi:cell division protein FtsW